MTDPQLMSRWAEIDALRAEIDALRPLPKKAVDAIRAYYRIGLTYTSNALEGNSLTESETKVVIEEGITIGGKPLRDHNEALGHAEAYDLLYELSKSQGISEKDIQSLHRLFFYRIDAAHAGVYRTVNVIITGTDFIPPAAAKIGSLMQAFASDIPKLRKKAHPVEFAALIHLRLVTIHPFIDGNGRAGRLLMNLALLQAGYPIAVIPPVVRSKYLEAIRRAEGPQGSTKAFVQFIADMVCESQKDYRRLFRALNGENGE